MSAEQMTFAMPVAGMTPVSLAWANTLIARWGHLLGPVERPFGSQAWVLDVAGEPVSVAVSASAVSATVTGKEHGVPVSFDRQEIVELARQCSAPEHRWATRPMVRLWREVAAPLWPYWPVTAAISYQLNSQLGDIYRFDGWTRIATDCGSSGGGTWSKVRADVDLLKRRKSLWLWRYEHDT